VADNAAAARVDQALAARARHGDRQAFEQLVRRHQGMVRAQLRRLLHGDHALADDLAQDTFLLAWRKLAQFRGDALFSTWLYRIAYTCFLQARRQPTQRERTEAEGLALLQAPADGVDLQVDLQRCMGRLSTAEQAVLLHCVQMGLSHDQAAYVLAMPLGTVKTHALRGKAKLKACLAAWRADDSEETHP